MRRARGHSSSSAWRWPPGLTRKPLPERTPTASVGPTFSTCASSGAGPLVVGELRLCGELGVRGEVIANESFAERDTTRDDDSRFRERVRVRLGLEYRAAEPVSLGIRLSSGDPAFPSSAWTSFSDDFRRKAFQIDRAFLRWDPHARAHVTAGLQANPLFTPTELVWDSDVHPAGVSESAALGGGVTATAGQFMLREVRSSRPANQENAFLIAEGLTLDRRWAGTSLRLGVSHYWLTNPDALSRSLQTGELDAELRTNRFDPSGSVSGGVPLDYFSDFRLVVFGAQLDNPARRLGVRLEGVINTGARTAVGLGEAFERPQRVAVGGELRYGRLQQAGDWLVRAGYFHIEADAVIAVYNSDDLQQTNVDVVVGELQRRFAGRTRVVWDTYLQRKVDTALASNGGVVHAENATKVRSRVSVIVDF